MVRPTYRLGGLPNSGCLAMRFGRWFDNTREEVTNIDSLPVYIRHFWAKADRHAPYRVHLLEHHLADVGACLEALLGQPTIRRRLARTAGRDDLDEVTVARLAVFAALHDIGKVNVGFQTRIWRREDLDGMPKRPKAGHISDLTPVLEYKDTETAGWFFDAFGWDDMVAWDDNGGLTASGLLVATLSHHGRPLELNKPRSRNSGIWRRFGELDPRRCVERIGEWIRQWFPAAFANGRAAAAIRSSFSAYVPGPVHIG